MSGSGEVIEFIEVDRYVGPDSPPEPWDIRAVADTWSATGPEGPLSQSFSDPVAALIESGACVYARGAALDITTSESFDPFRLLPALASWAEAPGAPHEGASDWSAQPRIGWIERLLEDQGRLLHIDYGRLIRINDLICGAYLPRDKSGSEPERHLVLFEPANVLRPVFYDAWASTSTDNGWGTADYEIGEVTPGFEGEIRHVSGHEAELRISRLAADHPKGLYDAMVSWVADIDSMTFGLEDEMGETDEAPDGDDSEGADGDLGVGSFGPTVLRSKRLV